LKDSGDGNTCDWKTGRAVT